MIDPARALTAALAGLAGAALLMPLTIRALVRVQLIDAPNSRSSHTNPVPRGGGIAVVLATLIGSATADWTIGLVGLAIGAVLLGAVGLVDDRRGLSARRRLFGQIVIVVAVLPFFLSNFGNNPPWLVVFSIGTVLVIVGYVNATNFMDGINGMAGFHAVAATLAFAYLAWRFDLQTLSYANLALAGACAGFLPFNALKAKAFLGDVGAYFIGFWLAGSLVLLARGGVPAEVAVAPLACFVFDTAFTVLRRWRSGQRITEAHREHSYQQLVARGWSHSQTTLLYAGVTTACSVISLTSAQAALAARAAACGLAAVLALVPVALPYVLQRRGSTAS